MINQPIKTLIIGMGNDLRGDDAVGPRVADRVSQLVGDDPTVHVEVCAGLTPDLATMIADAQRVIFIDCNVDGRVGEVERREVNTADHTDMSMVHLLDPAALLCWTQKMFGSEPRGVLLTVGGESFTISEQLSAPVAAAVPRLIDAVMREIGAVHHA